MTGAWKRPPPGVRDGGSKGKILFRMSSSWRRELGFHRSHEPSASKLAKTQMKGWAGG